MNNDVLYLAIVVLAFLGLRGLVRVCDQVIGPDAESDLAGAADEAGSEPDPKSA